MDRQRGRDHHQPLCAIYRTINFALSHIRVKHFLRTCFPDPTRRELNETLFLTQYDFQK